MEPPTAAADGTAAEGASMTAGEDRPSTVPVGDGGSDALGLVAGVRRAPGATVAGALVDGTGVGTGGAVAGGHVPAGDAGGGSGAASGSYRNPTSSPAVTVALDAPRAEPAHAPPARAMKSTQYEPEGGRHSVYCAGSLSI